MAGNTRLCTAAAMGENLNVFIAKIGVDSDINEKWSEKYKKSITEKDKQSIIQKARDNFPNIVGEKSLVARMDENGDVTIWYSYKGNLNILNTIVGN